MRKDFVRYLHSPKTKVPLQCEVLESAFKKDYEIVVHGRLFTDTEEYPIIDGIPRILSADLLSGVLMRHRGFVERFGSQFRTLYARAVHAEPSRSIEKQSQDSFGYQWNEFSEFYVEAWEKNFWMYVGKNLIQQDFLDKTVLDIGCGFGRHLYFAAKYGAKVAVGVDLSHAVEAAADNLKVFDNVLILQADVHNLPFVECFDTAYTIGVLQHVTNPGEAIGKIAKRLKPRGRFFAWVYGPRPWSYHIVVDSLRRITTTMTPSQLYYLSFLLAIPSYILFVLPRKLLEICGARTLASKVPFSHYARYPFRVTHTDWFDRLGAPKTEYFTQAVCNKFLVDAGLTETSVMPRKGGGWLLGGIQE